MTIQRLAAISLFVFFTAALALAARHLNHGC